jgi:hypothetical protein
VESHITIALARMVSDPKATALGIYKFCILSHESHITIALAQMVSDPKVVVGPVVNMNRKRKMVKDVITKTMDEMILIIMVNIFRRTSDQPYLLQ